MIDVPENGEGIIILGAQGTLGQQMAKVFPSAQAWDRKQLDITNEEAARQKLSQVQGLSAVINCVAFNDVDGAESNHDGAFALNAEAPGMLARICKELKVPFVHYSTGFVFDGTKNSYSETAPTAPLSVYAESKVKGEEAVAEARGAYYIIRTNVLFGPRGSSEASKPSFVDIMLNLAAKQDTIKVVNDEINSITYAPDLARASKDLITSGRPEGIYHIVNSGFASWYEFAQEIFKNAGKEIKLEPVAGSEFPRPAKRPARVVLENTKLPILRPWQEALVEYLNSNIKTE